MKVSSCNTNSKS